VELQFAVRFRSQGEEGNPWKGDVVGMRLDLQRRKRMGVLKTSLMRRGKGRSFGVHVRGVARDVCERFEYLWGRKNRGRRVVPLTWPAEKNYKPFPARGPSPRRVAIRGKWVGRRWVPCGVRKSRKKKSGRGRGNKISMRPADEQEVQGLKCI